MGLKLKDNMTILSFGLKINCGFLASKCVGSQRDHGRTAGCFISKDGKMIPKEINIVGQVYKIKFIKTIPHPSPNAVGLCDPNTYTIYLHESLKEHKAALYETLGHEYIHGVMAAIGSDQMMSEEMVEVLAQSIGRSIMLNLSFWKKLK
jgi:hypothetical protein